MSREHAMAAVTKTGEVVIFLLYSNPLSAAALPDSKDSVSLLNVYIYIYLVVLQVDVHIVMNAILPSLPLLCV